MRDFALILASVQTHIHTKIHVVTHIIACVMRTASKKRAQAQLCGAKRVRVYERERERAQSIRTKVVKNKIKAGKTYDLTLIHVYTYFSICVFVYVCMYSCACMYHV